MSSIERAKRFVAEKASRLALAVVPLAAIAISSVPAKAGSITGAVLDSGTCVVNLGNGSCGDSVSGVSGGNASMNIASVFTTTTVSSSSFSGSQGVELQASNSGSGTLSGSVPVSWDFNLINTVDPTVNWGVGFILFTSTGSGLYQFTRSGSASTSASPGTAVTGTGSITLPGTETITGWAIMLQLSSSGGPYGVNIPGAATLDLNPLSSAPEPSSLLLMIPGMGALLLMRRKRRG